MCGEVTKQGSYSTAVYWKNDSIVYLGDGTRFSTPEAIFIDSNDVYVGGYEEDSHGNMLAVYWKNGIKVILGNGLFPTYIYDITVNNGTVYAAGVQYTSNGEVATLWVNGTQTTLSSTLNHSRLNAVAVKGNDVYVGGYDELTSHTYVAKIWKNGTSEILTSGPTNGEVLSLCINSNDVFTLGYEIINSNTSEKKIYIWKNGVSFPFFGGSFFYSSSIRVITNDIYVPGYQETNNRYYAKYFKNGVEVSLPDEGLSAFAMDIGVKFNKTIVVGCLLNTNNNLRAAYWLDGNLIKLDSGFRSSLIKKIFVK